MDKMMERIKDRLVEKDSPIKSLKALAEAIGMSEGGFYLMFKKGTMKLKTKEAICEALGVDESYFSENSINDESDDSFGGDVLSKIAREMQSMRHSFEEQLRAKDRQLELKDAQIAGLIKTVDTLVGKSEGATGLPLSVKEKIFPMLYQDYTEAVAGQVSKMLPGKSSLVAKSVAPR